MTSIRVVESLTGVGTVYKAGVPVGSFPYSITVTQKMIEGTVPGLRSADGHIDVPLQTAIALISARNSLTLALNDGRKVDFYLTNANGSITCSGAFY